MPLLVHCFQIESELGVIIVFVEGRKPEKILHVKPTQVIKPRPHCWETHTFPTVLSLLLSVYNVSLK